MRFAVIGAGSIGRRHISNLLDMGHEIAGVCDINSSSLNGVHKHCPSCILSGDLARVMETGADAALICSPPHLHVLQARVAIEHGMHVFIEKPLCNKLDDVSSLKSEADSRKRIILVGFNLRFLPSLILLKKFLAEGRIGRPLSARASFGYYLPYWRKNTDYRDNYAAKSAAGGGVILDMIHELDYLYWFFGSAKDVFCRAGKLSGLEIDSEDNADIILGFDSGIVASVHLDYLRFSYNRFCEIIGTDGLLSWDYNSRTVTWQGRQDNPPETFREAPGNGINQTYIEEMKHFIDCINGNAEPVVGIDPAASVLATALSAKRSAQERTMVQIIGRKK